MLTLANRLAKQAKKAASWLLGSCLCTVYFTISVTFKRNNESEPEGAWPYSSSVNGVWFNFTTQVTVMLKDIGDINTAAGLKLVDFWGWRWKTNTAATYSQGGNWAWSKCQILGTYLLLILHYSHPTAVSYCLSFHSITVAVVHM